MKNLSVILVITAFLIQGCVNSKKFSNTTLVESTPLKHQKFTGQCWSFASTSLLEAEAMRLNYAIPELSAFYFVYLNYLENAEDYIKNKGKSHLNNGDLTFSVLEVFEKYGAVPASIYNGNLSTVQSKKQMLNRWKEEDKMNALIKKKLDSLIDVNASTDQSLEVVKGILNEYIGEIPESFTFEGKTETPESFTKKYLPLEAQDYLELTSYTHHPFHEKVLLEIPANWREKKYLNLPIESFMNTVDHALNNGFTLAWDGDIGTKEGFNNNGYVRVKGEYEDEKLISQEQRQSAYDRGTTRDDHNMHLVGYTFNRKGEKFYMLKNTWGKQTGIDGLYYLSENYFRLRTISVTVHKNGIPKEFKGNIN